jgi:hypothetical protein
MDQKMIPYFCHEGEMARAERTIKRLWILCILLVVLLVGTNIAWIHYENQWETAETVVTQDIDTVNGGNASINDGVHINGTRETDGQDEDQKTQDR